MKCTETFSPHLISHSGKDDEKGRVERAEDDADGEGGDVAGDGGAVAVRVQRGAAVLAPKVEPTLHCWTRSS